MLNEISSGRDDAVRQLTELAIRAGRKRQSSQTGYIHHCYHIQEEEIHYPIPMVENILFALALFRTRTSENMIEAKDILQKLLAFQNSEDPALKGNFPIYLHDFPQCKDRYIGVHLLPPFFWIMKHYQQVLGNQLNEKLISSINFLLAYCLKIQKEKPAPYFIGIKLAAGLKAFGFLFKNAEIEQEGEILMQEFIKQGQHPSWMIPQYIGDICIALQMIYPDFNKSPWSHFWDHLSNTWHRTSSSYIGPAIREFQQGEQPQQTLYDLYMGCFSNAFSQRALMDSPIHLQAALIQPMEGKIPPVNYPYAAKGEVQGHSWKMFSKEKYAYALLDKSEALNPSLEKGFHLMRILWGTNRAHTLVCQGGNPAKLDFKAEEEEILLNFWLNDPAPGEDREKNKEIAFYVDVQDGAVIQVEGERASTFKMDEKVDLFLENLNCQLKFSLLEGEGQFMGHIMRGNRPSQISLKGENKYHAYDWQIFLRTLRRSSPCLIQARIKIDERI